MAFYFNGGSIVGMQGKNCVGIASDKRLGQLGGYMTLDTNFQKIFRMQDNILLGLAGFSTHVQIFHNILEYNLNLYTLKYQRPMKPSTFKKMVATTLYERR